MKNIYDNLELLVNFLKDNELTITTAESVTAGRFSALMTSFSGSSKYFDSGFITYSTKSKVKMLGIDKSVVVNYGVVSKEVSYEMAKNSLEKANTNISISFTGNAGPNPIENKPIGTTYITIIYRDRDLVETYKFQSTKIHREEIIFETMEFAVEKLIHVLRIQ